METIKIKIDIDGTQVNGTLALTTDNLKRLVQQSDSLSSSGKSAFKSYRDNIANIGFAIDGARRIFDVINGTLGDSVRAYQESENASTKLTQALKSQGIYSEILIDDLKKFAAERQRLTGIDDDAIVSIMGQLTAMGLQGKALKDAVVAVQDLSTLMDGDMQGAVRVIADAFDGNAGMLKRYIKGLDEADIKERGTISIIEQLTKAVGGQAEAMGNTGAGAIKKFEADLGDAKESVGEMISLALIPLVNVVDSMARAFNGLEPPVKNTAIAIGFVAAAAYALQSVGIIAFLGKVTVAVKGISFAWTGLSAAIAITNALIGGVAIAALSVFGLLIEKFYLDWKLKQKEIEHIASSSAAMTQETIDKINKLPSIKLKIQSLDFEIKESKARLQELYDYAEKLRADSASDQDIAKADAARDAEVERLKRYEDTKTSIITDSEKKRKANAGVIATELEELRVKTMQDGYAKHKAQAELEYAEALKKLNERLKKEEILQEDYTKFLALEQKKRDDIVAPPLKKVKIKSTADAEAEETERNKKALDKRVKDTGGALKKIDEAKLDALDNSAAIDKKNAEDDDANKEAQQKATEQNILAATQQYDTSKSFAENMKDISRANIKRIIAEAVATQLAKVISMIPFPLNIVAAPAAGIAVQAMIEKIVPKFAIGGLIGGQRHAQGGTLIEAEEGEFIMNRVVTQKHFNFLSALNAGKITLPKFSTGGVVGSVVATVSNAGTDLKREFKTLTKAIINNPPIVKNSFDTDWTRMRKGERKLQRVKAAYAL